MSFMFITNIMRLKINLFKYYMFLSYFDCIFLLNLCTFVVTSLSPLNIDFDLVLFLILWWFFFFVLFFRVGVGFVPWKITEKIKVT